MLPLRRPLPYAGKLSAVASLTHAPVSGFRAVQSGTSLVAGQHLRFITACAAMYMAIEIVNFLVAVRDSSRLPRTPLTPPADSVPRLQRRGTRRSVSCARSHNCCQLGWDGKLDCSNIQVAILVGLVFVGIVALVAVRFALALPRLAPPARMCLRSGE